MPDFVHLHLHTLYSLLDGAIRIKDLLKTVHAKGMRSVAVTDHGNLFGAVDFYGPPRRARPKAWFTSGPTSGARSRTT
jgi:DNA polymerase-3 subunit alpha